MSSATLTRLNEALRHLPPQQADAARFVIGRAFDAATTPMRGLARSSGLAPVTFTRLAQSLGMSGWDELKALLVEETREGLTASHRGPFSARAMPEGGENRLVAGMIEADQRALGEIDPAGIARAAAVLEGAPRVLVAGFRSCHAPAMLFHYLYRLFRTEVALIGGMGGVLDVELGGLRGDDALLLFGFDPYSRDGLLCAHAAADIGAKVVAVVDTPAAPIAEGAAVVLTFGSDSPGFFPSLSACTGVVQALAATLYLRAGSDGKEQLRRTEARIEAHTAYLSPARSQR